MSETEVVTSTGRTLQLAASLEAFDIVVIVAYFLIVFAIGYWVARKNQSEEDLFLGGRSFIWPFIGLSIFASNISSSTLIGLAGAAYTAGIPDSVFEWGAGGIPLALFALFYVPLYLNARLSTTPQFLQLRYNSATQKIFSAASLFISVFVGLAGDLYAGGVTIRSFLPGLSIWVITIGLSFIAGIYTAFGGLKAVVYTDAIQSIILLIGGISLTAILFSQPELNWSLEALVNSAPPGHFSIYRPADDDVLPWTSLLYAVPMLQFWYFTTNQIIAQRVLGAKNIQHARWGIVLGGFMKFLPFFFMVIPGAMMISIAPGIEIRDQVFPAAVINFLPTGMIGLVLAGLLAAIMSSVDSTLNSAATLILHDFVLPWKPKMSESRKIWTGRAVTFTFMVFAALWAPLIELYFSSLWSYLQSTFAVIVPPIIILYTVGLLDSRSNGQGAVACFAFGIGSGLLMFFLNVFEVSPLHYTHNIGIVFIPTALVFMGVSRLYPAPDQAMIEPYMLRRGLVTQGMEGVPLWKDYRVHLGILGVCVALHYALLTG